VTTRIHQGLVVLISLLIYACVHRESASGSLQPRQLDRWNVLLVTIDTLRADRLGAYGHTGGLTPTLDRLAATGVRYTHAWSHAPMTLPAHSSILTGLLPPHHGVRNNTAFRLDDGVATMGTLLRAAGYRTGAFVGAFVLDARFGLARGFDVYDDRLPHAEQAAFRMTQRRGQDVIDAAASWVQSIHNPQSAIRSPQSPWLAWVHLFDPHTPYDAPADYQRPGRSAYEAEVAYADAMVGVLLDRLREAGQLAHTLIVVTADHGESLGDHGETTHGLFAYDSTLRVPLIVQASAIAPATVDTPAVHADILPTILDLVGVPVPDRLDGTSLARSPAADRPLYFEALDASLTRGWAPLTGVVRSGWKYIDLPDAELYDLGADPQETRNRIADSRQRDELRGALERLKSGDRRGPAAALDPNAARQLRSLGYTGGATTATHAASKADDPKALVALNERFNSALTAFDEGRTDAALASLRGILGERADFLSARTTAATVLVSQGRAQQAAQLLQEAPADQRNSPELQAKLGAALRAAGDLRQAATVLEQARRAGNRSPDLMQDLAVTDAALGRSSEARALFDELVASNPTAATTWYNVGLFELQSGRPGPAAVDFRKAVEREPAYGDAWQALGAALVGTDAAGAIDAWRHAERLLPRDYDLLFNLAMLSAERDTPANAVPYLRRFVREAPRDRYARDLPRVEQTLARLERQTR
jgi:arylsulfatase A-like enzyme/Tfp pilus assembly protein PilF